MFFDDSDGDVFDGVSTIRKGHIGRHVVGLAVVHYLRSAGIALFSELGCDTSCESIGVLIV